jgi:NTP pyrophosphatase (non-canonical NTP hydrolase)
METSELTIRAMNIFQLYKELNKRENHVEWCESEVMMGFVGDVGDLMKLVMAESNLRQIPDSKEKIAHELADCLWSILVLSKLHKIDIENAFIKTMTNLEEKIQKKLDQ